MKVKVLTDIRIECEPPNLLYWGRTSLDEQAKELERWVKDFHEFIRDHRSQDPVKLSVERVYEEQCSFCHLSWEEDAVGPVCCDAALQEIAQRIMDKALEQNKERDK